MTQPPHILKLAVIGALLCQLVLAPCAHSAPFSYFQAADGSQAALKTTLPVTQLGQLAIPGGLAVFDGNAIEVQAVPEGLFDPRQVLAGVMVKSQTIPAASPQAIKGLAYFFSGTWLHYLSQPPTFEVIEKTDGTILTGQVTGGDEKSINLRKTSGEAVSVDFAQIASIESPRAFSFLMPLIRNAAPTGSLVQGQTSSVRFNANNGGQRIVAARRIVSPMLGDDKGISKGTILSYLMLDLFATIAPAIATPIVINNRNTQTAARITKQVNAASGLP